MRSNPPLMIHDDDDEHQIYNKEKNLIYTLDTQFKIVSSKNGVFLKLLLNLQPTPTTFIEEGLNPKSRTFREQEGNTK